MWFFVRICPGYWTFKCFLNSDLNFERVFIECKLAGRSFQRIMALGKKLANVELFLTFGTGGSSDWRMTMGKWKLCVRWSDCRGSPSSISLASKKNRPSWCLFHFRMATVLPLRTAWIADIHSQAFKCIKRSSVSERQPCCNWKRGSGDGQRLWDYFIVHYYGTTERSFNAVDKWGSTLTWTVCKAIGGSR